MKDAAFLLVAALALPLLAGCADPAGPGPSVQNPGLVAVAPTELSVGGFYAFHHGGGDLVFQTAGEDAADVVLYGGDDRRIGRIGLGGDGAAGRFTIDQVAAGELVVEVRALDGEEGLDIRSAGSRIRDFEALPVHIERHVLLQRDNDLLGGIGISGLAPRPADENLDLQLLRAPSALRLLHQSSYQDLAVAIVGEDGIVLRAEQSGGPVQPEFGPSLTLTELPSEVFSENVRDGRFSVQVSAADFRGVLLLEAESFSRARPVPSDVESTDDEPTFTYGVLPDRPVSFHVRAGALWLYLLFEGDDGGANAVCRDAAEDAGADPERSCGQAALVALFGPDDERVATVRVPFNQTVAIPVHAHGEWVAVLLDGQATLGTDRVPADFEMHPLEVRSAQVPAASASGETGAYGQAVADVPSQGFVYRLRGQWQFQEVFQIPIGTSPSCGPSSIVAVQGGETIGAWGFGTEFDSPGSGGSVEPVDSLDPDSLLDGRPLRVVHDDFGPDCERITLVLDSYVR